MVESFTAPPTITGPDGKEYPNLKADLHSVSAYTCIDPDWFKDIPEHLIVEHSKRVRAGQKRCSRDNAKVLNFHEIYLGSAESLAERNNIPLALAKVWDKNFHDKFSTYFDWAAEVARIDVNRGYSINALHRCRWVLESNSKGSEDSPERAAVNNRNQSLASDIAKEADLQCYYAFRHTDVKCVLQVHDALVFEVPGSASVDWDNSKQQDGVWTKLKFNVSQEAQDIATQLTDIMAQTQTQIYSSMGSHILGAADAGVSLYWGH